MLLSHSDQPTQDLSKEKISSELFDQIMINIHQITERAEHIKSIDKIRKNLASMIRNSDLQIEHCKYNPNQADNYPYSVVFALYSAREYELLEIFFERFKSHDYNWAQERWLGENTQNNYENLEDAVILVHDKKGLDLVLNYFKIQPSYQILEKLLLDYKAKSQEYDKICAQAKVETKQHQLKTLTEQYSKSY